MQFRTGFSSRCASNETAGWGASSPAAGRRTLHRVQLPAMTNLASALKQLEQERNRLSSRLEQLNKAVSALTGASSTRRGTISPAGRARIAAAQRARRAKAKGQKVVSIVSRKRRKYVRRRNCSNSHCSEKLAGLNGGKISRRCELLCHYITSCTRWDRTVLLEWSWWKTP